MKVPQEGQNDRDLTFDLNFRLGYNSSASIHHNFVILSFTINFIFMQARHLLTQHSIVCKQYLP